MSHLLEFYRGSRADTEGRLLKDIWTWDDDELEEVHDYIHWLFPLEDLPVVLRWQTTAGEGRCR